MISYRITKYNPKKRNKAGHYTDNSEWISINDIGNPKYNNLTFQAYEKIETAYVKAVLLAMKEKGIGGLEIQSLENYNSKDDFEKLKNNGTVKNIKIDFEKDINSLKNGEILNLEKIENTIKIILREICWMLLVNTNFEVKFGYDYYMYFKCDKLNPETVREIEDLGLFVERDIEASSILVVDENGNKI